jgi:hypothetical protein
MAVSNKKCDGAKVTNKQTNQGKLSKNHVL